MFGLLPRGGSVAARARTRIGPRGHMAGHADGQADSQDRSSCALVLSPRYLTEPGRVCTGTESGQGPRGEVRLFHQKSTCIMQITSGPQVVQILAQQPPNFEATRAAYSTVWLRGTSLIRNIPPVGPYSRTIPRIPWQPWLGGWAVSYERGTPVIPTGGRVRQQH